MGSTVLFSGRFDRIHPGHIMSIIRLTKRYDKVIVCILDYPDRLFAPEYVKGYLVELCASLRGLCRVVINKEHFAEITLEQISRFTFDVYASGNHKCLNHVRSLGYAVEYVERAYDWSATDGRTIKKIMEALDA